MTRCYDKHGNELREFDVVKVYHFTGARRKKHYMYKWLIIKQDELYALHLEGNSGDGYWIKNENIEKIELVQTAKYDDGRKLKGPVA